MPIRGSFIQAFEVFFFVLVDIKNTEDTEIFMSSLRVWFNEIIALGPAGTLIGVCVMQNQNLI